MEQIQKVTIFCSYAHKDRSFAQQLKTHFAGLGRAHSLVLWTEMEIHAGEEWKQTTQGHLDTAQVILLLVSPDFMASEYCYSKEMKRAVERHEQKEARVIPIIIRPVADWESAPFGKLRVLPEGGKPITDPSWHRRDNALFHVVKEIAKALGLHLGENKVSTPSVVSNSPLSRPTPDASSLLQVVPDSTLILVDQRPEESAPTQAESEQIYTTIALQMLESRSPGLSLAPDGSVQIERTSVRIFGHQADAYRFLIEIIEQYDVTKAVLLQYSCRTSLDVLRALLRRGADVTLYIQHEDTAAKIGSQFQADRIVHAMRDLPSDLGDALKEPNKLKIYKYRTPSSMSAIKIDDRALCMGWYTYEQRDPLINKTYPDDTIELSGHDRAAVVVWKGAGDTFELSGHDRAAVAAWEGRNEFQALDQTFSVLERNYRRHAEVVDI